MIFAAWLNIIWIPDTFERLTNSIRLGDMAEPWGVASFRGRILPVELLRNESMKCWRHKMKLRLSPFDKIVSR